MSGKSDVPADEEHGGKTENESDVCCTEMKVSTDFDRGYH